MHPLTPPGPPEPVFRIRADGEMTTMSTTTLLEARALGSGLFDQGHKVVEIIDGASGSLVERLPAPPP